MEAGWNRVIGADPTLLRTTLADRAFLDRARERPTLYGDGRAAERIVAAIDEGKVAGA